MSRSARLYDVLKVLPGVWENILRYSTAFFVLAEGMCVPHLG